MKVTEVRENAKKRFAGTCKVCKICNGIACAGEVPGMGGAGTGQSFINNIEALKKIKLKLSTLHDATDPVMNIDIWGNKLSAPIMTAPINGSSINFGGYLEESNFIELTASAANDMNLLAMTGDTADYECYKHGLTAIDNVGKGIPTIKPRDVDSIIERIRMAEKSNATAIAIDVDGSGITTMALSGQPVGPLNRKMLEQIIKSTELPVILKGIMTVKEAEIVVEVGAKGIVVSNHGGRVLDGVAGVAEVLESISDKVKGKIIIMADSGVRSGVDIYKYLALGADIVLIGRPIIIGAVGGGKEGVETILGSMKNELYRAMILTGCKTLREISTKNIIGYK